MKSCATHCFIQPGEIALPGVGMEFRECLFFRIDAAPERRLPPSMQRSDMATFILKPWRKELKTSLSGIGAESTLSDISALQSPRSNSTRSRESWALAEEWIATCINSHRQCNAVRNDSWLPTRLIDLQRYQSKNKVLLVDTSTIVKSGRYVTLSHRWGSYRPYCLDKATEVQLRAGIDLRILPQAFQDAIEVCRRLKVRYIWIDSLCIMQDPDDLEDWTREAASMDRVYLHSFLNISALAAADSSASFFAERDSELLEDGYIRTGLKRCKLGTEPITYSIINLDWLEQQVSCAPLNLKAWVLQERLLAPRVLHFGSTQLIWECREMECAESHPRGLAPEMAVVQKSRVKSLDAAFEPDWMSHVLHNYPPEMASYRHWNNIVKTYTTCGITKSGDKLIAISGIAKHVKAELDDEYVCGMWRKYLPSALLWRVYDVLHTGRQSSYRPRIYRAPSWLWASLEGAIWLHNPLDKGLLIDVLDVSLDFATDDVTGLVKGGYLLLQCQVQTLSFRRNTSVDGNDIMSVNGIDVAERGGDHEHSLGHLDKIALDEDDSYFDPAVADQATLFCVPALVYDGVVLILLSLQTVDAPVGTYRRVGIANLPNLCRSVLRRPFDHDVDIPAVAMENGKHIIRLI